jgi:hypothetical protein
VDAFSSRTYLQFLSSNRLSARISRLATTRSQILVGRLLVGASAGDMRCQAGVHVASAISPVSSGSPE